MGTLFVDYLEVLKPPNQFPLDGKQARMRTLHIGDLSLGFVREETISRSLRRRVVLKRRVPVCGYSILRELRRRVVSHQRRIAVSERSI
jgi:hypothetical protein